MYSIVVNGIEYDLELYSSLEDILEEAAEAANGAKDEDEDDYVFTELDIDWSESNVPEQCQNDDCFEFICVADIMDTYERHYGAEIVTAGLNVGLELHQIEDSYIGKYDSDIDFAWQMFEDTKSNEVSGWPYDCIDWEKAARELMCDYNESNGYYFTA